MRTGRRSTNGEVGVLVVRLEDELRVVVRDEGRGIDEPPAGGGFGLQIIARVANRRTLHGGDTGTTVSMSFDLGRDGTD